MAHTLIHVLDIDSPTAALLDANGFDEPTFAKLQADFAAGALAAEHNRIAGRVELTEPGDVAGLPEEGSEEWKRLYELGSASIARGELGVAFLVGGMATRFGGVVKAAVDVVPGRSFLDLKLADVRRAAREAGASIPVMLMSSFATHERILEQVDGLREDGDQIDTFTQNVSLRLTPEADLFRSDDGDPVLYAPGHGDFPECLAKSGLLESFRASGGKYVWMSNVDNVLAGVDPVVLGAHIDGQAPVTVEVCSNDGVPGGAPARVDGLPQIVENFRFPAEFDQSQIQLTSTNTFIFDSEVLAAAYPLTWFVVEKGVDGRTAIQFERLVGEVTAFAPTRIVEVDRHGPASRFCPIKDPAALDEARSRLSDALTARGII